MTTAAEHATLLHAVANHIDPREPAQIGQQNLAPIADELRAVAKHLDRIALGGDADPGDERIAYVPTGLEPPADDSFVRFESPRARRRDPYEA